MLLDEYYRADPELRDVWIALRISCKAPVRSAPFSGRSAGPFWKREPAGRPALSFCGEKQ